MSDDLEKAVCVELDQVAADLEVIRDRLTGLRASLPASPREDVMFVGEEDFDFVTEVRTGLECILADAISAAIRDLRNLANYRPGERSSRLHPIDSVRPVSESP